MTEMTEDCSICLEEMTFGTTVMTGCLHLFHFECFLQLEASGAITCPICRKQVFENYNDEDEDNYEQELIEMILDAERNEADEFFEIERLIDAERMDFASHVEMIHNQQNILDMYSTH